MTSELRFEGGGRSAALKLMVSPRARVMRLRVDRRTGDVVLTVPRRVSQRKALDWASGHRAWIEAQLASLGAGQPLVAGSEIPLFGLPHRVDWDPARPRTPRLEGQRVVAGGPAEGLEARLTRWLARTARALLEAETHEFAARAGVAVTRVAVGDPVSRWGSCAASGAIRYSWRLILAPDWVRRATVAHEVAHRVHMNHGPAFHALVADLLGADPKPARLWLRREGPRLHRVGRR
ncbi:MAG: M48 family metallopeptidase [Alphaproteobacteria bacterium]|nr:M48 family metallopeptidase [Alphaproteobacteria bacterium]